MNDTATLLLGVAIGIAFGFPIAGIISNRLHDKAIRAYKEYAQSVIDYYASVIKLYESKLALEKLKQDMDAR